jgi:hypothetical protein
MTTRFTQRGRPANRDGVKLGAVQLLCRQRPPQVIARRRSTTRPASRRSSR